MTDVKAAKTVTRVIALEEAFLHPKLRERYEPTYVRLLDLIKDRLCDVGAERIRQMDEAGIDVQVLSHITPGVQDLDRDAAVSLSREINDWLGEVIEAYPTRFYGFAMLPTQSPADAADELERTVTQLKFKGALINGHTQGRYLDDDAYAVLFERAQALDVPIYIHPTNPPQAIVDTYYRGYPALMQAAWGWAVETGTHLLRLICAGIFDQYPRLKVIVGHMGELIPFHLKRVNLGIMRGTALLAAHGAPPQKIMQKSVLDCMRENVFITTSGLFEHSALLCSLTELGIDNILFSVDYPFADNFAAMTFLNTAPLSQDDKEKLAHGNAERLLKLS